jgi:hypothetical protein
MLKITRMICPSGSCATARSRKLYGEGDAAARRRASCIGPKALWSSPRDGPPLGTRSQAQAEVGEGNWASRWKEPSFADPINFFLPLRLLGLSGIAHRRGLPEGNVRRRSRAASKPTKGRVNHAAGRKPRETLTQRESAPDLQQQLDRRTHERAIHARRLHYRTCYAG